MAEKPTSEKSGRFDTGLIRELAAILREADLGEIEIQQGEMRIKVTKPEPAPIAMTASGYAPAPAASPVAAAAPAAPAAGPAAGMAAAADHPGVVKSPMVGTVYLAPETGAAPFVKVGDSVNPGQTLLLVEAMKTFNPVTAPRAGKVVRIIVANEQPVEFGEPLIVVE
jgi:acetyl-CoA carboxylase biotin carboxyl carrier protein